MASEIELSDREIEILRLVATGVSNKEIAFKLSISPNTVKVHLRNVFTKIGAASRTEAALYAVRMGLVDRQAASPVLEAGTDLEAEPVGSILPVKVEEPAEEVVIISGRESRPPVRHVPAIWLAWAALGVLLVVALIIGALAVTRIGPFAPLPTQTSVSSPTPNPAGQVSSRWSEVSALPAGRTGMAAAAYEGAVYMIGGETAGGISASVLRYRPSSGGWETLADKPTPVSDVMAAVYGDQIFVPGGRGADGKPVRVLEAYSPRLNKWDTLTALPKALSGYALAAYEGRLYLFGGWDGAGYSASVYSFDPLENNWREQTPLPTPRAFAAAAVVETRIYVMGGFDGQQSLRSLMAYFPQRDRAGDHPWEERAPLPEGRYAMGCTALANNIYLVGGLSDAKQTADLSPVQYQPLNDRWATFERAPETVGERPALLALDTRLHVLGGKAGGSLEAGHLTYQAIYTIAIPSIQQ